MHQLQEVKASALLHPPSASHAWLPEDGRSMFTAPSSDLESKELGQGCWGIQVELPEKTLEFMVLEGPKLGGREFQVHTGLHTQGLEHTSSAVLTVEPSKCSDLRPFDNSLLKINSMFYSSLNSLKLQIKQSLVLG